MKIVIYSVAEPEPEPEPPGAVLSCWSRSRSRKKIMFSAPAPAPAPAPAIIQKKHFHNQQIFSKYDNEFRFLFSKCSVHSRLSLIFFHF